MNGTTATILAHVRSRGYIVKVFCLAANTNILHVALGPVDLNLLGLKFGPSNRAADVRV